MGLTSWPWDQELYALLTEPARHPWLSYLLTLFLDALYRIPSLSLFFFFLMLLDFIKQIRSTAYRIFYILICLMASLWYFMICSTTLTSLRLGICSRGSMRLFQVLSHPGERGKIEEYTMGYCVVLRIHDQLTGGLTLSDAEVDQWIWVENVWSFPYELPQWHFFSLIPNVNFFN